MGGSNLGAMVGGRGCVEDLGGDQYLVTIAWQGMGPVSAPPAASPVVRISMTAVPTAWVTSVAAW
jgi:hypothetical protein